MSKVHLPMQRITGRGNDISILAEFFLKKYSSRYNKPNLRINQQAHEKLLRYQWPGNIRELQHTIEKAVILSETSLIKPDDLFFRNAATTGNRSVNTIEEMEKQMIQEALEKNNGNFTAAAEQLGITRQTLYNKLRKSG